MAHDTPQPQPASGHQTRTASGLLSALLVGSLLAGCSVVGPDVIRSGRLAYNEAITDTSNQQILMVLVHNRYEERGSLLTVASVTANVRVSSNASVQAGFGDDSDYSGNLVPFSGGFLYEVNPTISYIPVEGEQYLHQLTSPVPIGLLAQVTRAFPDPSYVFTALVSSINGLYNPDFLFGEDEHDPRFQRCIAIISRLSQTHHLQWIKDPEHPDRLSLFVDRSARESTDLLRELLQLLGLPPLADAEKHALIPVSSTVYQTGSAGVAISTRSILQLIQIMSAAVQVPPEDERDGVAIRFPTPGLMGREVRFHYSVSKPERAYIAVNYRDGWYYIDERDQFTKAYFRLLGSLWSAAMAKSVGNAAAAPVLTVPVSR